MFRHPNKVINFDNLSIVIDGTKIVPSENAKYLGVYIDQHLSFKFHQHELSSKLRRANGMLVKLRHYVSWNVTLSFIHASFCLGFPSMLYIVPPSGTHDGSPHEWLCCAQRPWRLTLLRSPRLLVAAAGLLRSVSSSSASP